MAELRSEVEGADQVEAEADVARSEAGGGVPSQVLIDGRRPRVADDERKEMLADGLRERRVPGGDALFEVAVPRHVLEGEKAGAGERQGKPERDVPGVAKARRVAHP